MIRGQSLASISAASGLSEDVIRQRVRVFRSIAPEAYQQMADGLREFLANLALDDVLHWRPLSRDAIDTEVQKIASGNYKDAKDTLIKIFGLATQSLQISGSRQAPPTMEELAARIRSNPEMAAAVAKLQKAVEEQKS